MVTARAQQNKILLRWGIDSPIEWQNANKQGFVLYRLLLKENGKLLQNPVKKELARVKPAPLESWMELIQKDQMAAIIAQALYGDSFEVGQESEKGISKIVSMADELNQRHSFALYAADLSFEGALKAGWGYVDNDVKSGEVYAYQVEAYQIPAIQPGAFMIGLLDYEELPKVHDFMALPDDGQVMLSWGIERLKSTYTSYMIERSDDGKNFLAISPTPIVDLNGNSEKKVTQMFYANKFETNEKDYYFRIQGINAFGEKGPYSEILKTKGIVSLLVAPRIVNYTLPNSSEVTLEWEFPKEEEKNIKGFEIYFAEKDLTEYKVVSKDLPKEGRKYAYKGLKSSNYFKVAAVSNVDKRLYSQSTLVQPIDSIPPLKPLGLEGKIDSLGQVVLKWRANVEKDLSGYRVLRANAANEEFVDIYNHVITEPSALDKVSFAVSNSKVYYRVLAEDMRYNRSEFSDILIIEKPDKLPPTSPVFKNFETADGKNTLEWINSSSSDIDKHYLKRRLKGETVWYDIATFSKNETQYIDDKTEAEKTYEYLIQAKDKSGLYSHTEPSILTMTTLNNTALKILKNVEALVDRSKNTATLLWNYDTKYPVVEIQIFKNIKGEKPTLWKVLDGKYTSVVDKDLKLNSQYEYYLLPATNPQKPVKGEKVSLTF